MMRAAQARGHEILYCGQADLYSSGRVHANAGRLSLADNDEDWVRAHAPERVALASLDAVLMRKDPPFDMEYLYAAYGCFRRPSAKARASSTSRLRCATIPRSSRSSSSRSSSRRRS